MSEYGTYDANIILTGANSFTSETTALDLSSAVSGIMARFRWTVYWPARVKAFGYRVLTALAYTGTVDSEGILALDKRVLTGSETGRVEVARMDLEDGLGVGSVRFVQPDRTDGNENLEPGDELMLQIVTVASASGGTSGTYHPFIVLEARAETVANLADLTESTVTQV